jgi:hypothetical protein
VAGVLTLVLLFGGARRAAAVSPAADASFQEGRRLLAAGQTAEACLKFAESFALEASSGTLINLALCHEKQGKLATAWGEYQEASRLAREQGHRDRAEVANVKASLLEPRVPKVTLTAGQPPPGLRIEIDQRSLDEATPGTSIPVDPGPHQLTAHAPGCSPWTTTFDIGAGEVRQIEIPALEPISAIAASRPAAVPESAPSKEAPPPAPVETGEAVGSADDATKPSGTTRGWILMGSGAVLLGAGTVLGMVSLSDYRDADGLCPSHQNCGASAMSKRNDAEATAWASNLTFGAGAVAAIVGGYLFWKDRRRRGRTVDVTLAGGANWIGVAGDY